MENRDYFRLKRKQVYGAPNSKEAEGLDVMKAKTNIRGNNFFDTMSTSCDKRARAGFKKGKKIGPRGPKPTVTKV